MIKRENRQDRADVLETEGSAAEATDFDAAAEETVLETAGLESEAEELD